MPRLRAVAGLTGDNHVLALLLLIDDVGVASFTYIVAGKGKRPSRCLRNSSTAVVPVLSKAARHDGSAQEDESDQGYGHHDSEPDEVFDIL